MMAVYTCISCSRTLQRPLMPGVCEVGFQVPCNWHLHYFTLSNFLQWWKYVVWELEGLVDYF